jgi:protein involved in plasmid replication-relaxation
MTTIALSPLVTPRRKRRFVRETPNPFQLTDRDITIVRLVAQHRFLRSTHLSDLSQAPHKKICDRLTSLFHAGYLDRPRAQFDHYREGGGSSPIVYALGNRGAQLLIHRDQLEASDVDWARKNHVAGCQFIQHTLAIADVRVALQRAIRERPGFQLLEPKQLLETAPAETRRRERPWTWRSKVHYGDTTIELGVAPDYPSAIQYRDGRFRAFLVECDRGTMPVDRANLMQTSLKRKFLAYAAAKRADLHQRQFGWNAFRVLLITTNKQRVDNVLATIRECVHEHATVYS